MKFYLKCVLLFCLCLSYSPEAWATPLRTVIMPFENLTRREEHAWLSRSFAEYLNLSLGRFPSLELLERDQIQKLLQEQAFSQSIWANPDTAPELGQLLGAQKLVLGSYQLQGDQIRVQVRFVDVESGRIDPQLQFEIQGQSTELFALQRQLSEKISAAFQLRQDEVKAQQAFASLHLTESVPAHQAYTEGSQHVQQAQFAAALLAFQRAITLDPNYLLPYVDSAEVYASLYTSGKMFNVPLEARLKQALQLENLEDCLARAQVNLAHAKALASEHPSVQRVQALLDYAQGDKDQALDSLQVLMADEAQRAQNMELYLALLFDFNTQITSDKLSRVKALIQPHLDNPSLKSQYITLALDLPQSEAELRQLQDWSEELVQAYPQNISYRSQLAKVLIQRKQEQEALAVIEAGRVYFEGSAIGNRLAALIPLQLQDYALAARYLEKSLKLNPDNVQSLSLLATVRKAQKQEQQAAELYQRMTVLAPDHIPAWMGLAGLQSGAERIASYQQALRLTRQRLANQEAVLYPLDQVTAFLGYAHAYDKNYIQAAESLQEAARLESNLEQKGVYYQEAAVYLSLTPEYEALGAQRLALYHKALELSQSKERRVAVLLDLIGEYTLYQEDAQQAERLVQEALLLADQKQQAEVVLKWVQLLNQQQKFAEAKAQLQNYYPHKESPQYLYIMATIYAHQQQYLEASDWMKRFLEASPEILKTQPDGFYVHLYRSYVLESRLAQTPQDPRLLNDLGVAYLKMKNYDLALRIFEQNLKLDAQNPTLFYNLGTVYMLKERWPEAIVPLKQATELKPNYAAAWYNLGLAYLNTQQRDKAKAALVQLRLLQPNYPGLDAALESLLR